MFRAGIILDRVHSLAGVLRVSIALCLFHLNFFAASPEHVRLDFATRIPIGNKGGVVILSPDESALYVAQNYNDSVAVVNTQTRRLVRTVHVAHAPNSLAVSPDGKHVYVGQWGGQSDGQLSVIDTATGVVAPIYVGGPVPGVAMAADGRTLYLAMCRAGLRKMDTYTGAVQTIYRQFCPWGVALSPDQKSIWVNFQGGGPNGRRGHDSIARFDGVTGKLMGTITGLANVGGAIIVSHDGKTVWADGLDACWIRAYDHVGCPAVPAGVVHVIDAATLRLVHTFPKAQSGTIALSPDRRWAALTGVHLLLMNARDLNSVATVGEQFFGVVFSFDGSYMYATSQEKPEVVVMKVVPLSR